MVNKIAVGRDGASERIAGIFVTEDASSGVLRNVGRVIKFNKLFGGGILIIRINLSNDELASRWLVFNNIFGNSSNERGIICLLNIAVGAADERKIVSGLSGEFGIRYSASNFTPAKLVNHFPALQKLKTASSRSKAGAREIIEIGRIFPAGSLRAFSKTQNEAVTRENLRRRERDFASLFVGAIEINDGKIGERQIGGNSALKLDEIIILGRVRVFVASVDSVKTKWHLSGAGSNGITRIERSRRIGVTGRSERGDSR